MLVCRPEAERIVNPISGTDPVRIRHRAWIGGGRVYRTVLCTPTGGYTDGMRTQPANTFGDRLVELLSKATVGLSASERSELNRLVDNLGFEAVSRVDEADEMPIAGLATFRGVPYTFCRISDSAMFQFWDPPDFGFVLRPVDPRTGLTMHATGKFRPCADADPVASPNAIVRLEVRWTSYGAVGLNQWPDLRQRFADFLDGLAHGTSTAAHWDAFIINHYFHDELVETTRRECVRLLLETAKDPRSESEIQQLKHWACELRDAGQIPG